MSSDCRQDAAPACTLHVTVSQGQIAALQTRLASGGLSERERAPLRAGIYDAWLAAARSCWALETRPRCREDYRRNIAAVDAARRCVLDAMQ